MTIRLEDFAVKTALDPEDIIFGGDSSNLFHEVQIALSDIVDFTAATIVTQNAGGIVYSDGTTLSLLNGTPTGKQLLMSGVSAAPIWSDCTFPSSTTVNQLLYSSSNNVITGLASANNAVLVTNGSGVPSFGTLTSVAVTSLTGTANQVLVNGTSGSATAGAVTLTTPQNIGTSSNVQFGSLGLGVAASGTTGRLQTSGITKLGDSSAFTSVAAHEIGWVSAVGSFINVWLTGTMTNVSGTGDQAGLEIQNIFNTTSGAWNNADAVFLNPTYRMGANLAFGNGIRMAPSLSLGGGFTLGTLANFRSSAASTGGFAGGLTSFVGFFGEALNVGTNRYGSYILAPTGGTVAIASYTANLVVGTYNVTPPANSIIASGQLGVGTSAPLNKADINGALVVGTYAGFTTGPSNGFMVSGQTLFKETSSFINASVEVGGSDRVSFAIGGTKTSTDGSVQTSMYLGATYAPTSNTIFCANITSYPQFNPPMGVTIDTAFNHCLQAGGQGGSGAVTLGVNLFVENPGFGTAKIAAWLNGAVTVNTGTIDGSNKLTVNGGISATNMKMTTGAAAGKFVQGDASGNFSFQSLPSSTGSWILNTTTATTPITANYTATLDDSILFFNNASTGTFQIDLPALAQGECMILVNTNSDFVSGNTVLLACPIPGQINESLSYLFDEPGAILLVSSRGVVGGETLLNVAKFVP